MKTFRVTVEWVGHYWAVEVICDIAITPEQAIEWTQAKFDTVDPGKFRATMATEVPS